MLLRSNPPGVTLIDDVHHCLATPGDGPVVTDGLEVGFPETGPTARLRVDRERFVEPPVDPRDCDDDTVERVARFLAQHVDGDWEGPDRHRADGGDGGGALVWEISE